MEQKSIWKNFLLLTVGSLLALHINFANAADSSDASDGSDQSDGCVLTDE